MIVRKVSCIHLHAASLAHQYNRGKLLGVLQPLPLSRRCIWVVILDNAQVWDELWEEVLKVRDGTFFAARHSVEVGNTAAASYIGKLAPVGHNLDGVDVP